MPNSFSFLLGGLLLSAALSAATAQTSAAPVYGLELQGFDYPYELKHYAFESQGKQLQMGYMDVAAAGAANGRTVVLMHDRKFWVATWDQTIKGLSTPGYGVDATDQVGFCT